MRFRELLLEYRRDKTVSRWGDKMWVAVQRREDTNSVIHQIMVEVQEGIDVDVWGDREREIYKAQSLDMLFNWIEGRDPTANKEYMQWIVQRYCEGGINLLEDMHKAHDYLGRFHALKKSGFFRRQHDDSQYTAWLREMADINRFETLADLGSFIMDQGQQMSSNAAQDREAKARAIEESDMLLDSKDFLVACPNTEFAAKYWGRNTQWCTAAENNNLFDSYQEAPLYIILDKRRNRRWQLYFEGYAPMFMDERDEPLDWADFPARVWLEFDTPFEVFPAVILSAMHCGDEEMTRALLEKQLSTSSIVTAYIWAMQDKNKALADIAKSILTKNSRQSPIDFGRTEEGDFQIFKLEEFITRQIDQQNPILYSLFDTFAGDAQGMMGKGVRAAEWIDIVLHSSLAALVNAEDGVWHCFADQSRGDAQSVTCHNVKTGETVERKRGYDGDLWFTVTKKLLADRPLSDPHGWE